MKNVIVKQEGNSLTITCDLTANHGLSKSGKTQIIATTEGNQTVAEVNGEKVVLGLNLYKYAEPKR
jgi:hypothetical protein